jgi:hypothetical protein
MAAAGVPGGKASVSMNRTWNLRWAEPSAMHQGHRALSRWSSAYVGPA